MVLVGNEERLAFLQAVAKKVDNENSQDALVFASVEVSRVKLSLGDLDGARKDLDAAERILDSFDSVETVVHAAFYDANASYYQVMSTQPQSFHRLTHSPAQIRLCKLLPHSPPLPCLHRSILHRR
jgi:26S proteasome regulatory subunit N9